MLDTSVRGVDLLTLGPLALLCTLAFLVIKFFCFDNDGGKICEEVSKKLSKQKLNDLELDDKLKDELEDELEDINRSSKYTIPGIDQTEYKNNNLFDLDSVLGHAVYDVLINLCNGDNRLKNLKPEDMNYPEDLNFFKPIVKCLYNKPASQADKDAAREILDDKEFENLPKSTKDKLMEIINFDINDLGTRDEYFEKIHELEQQTYILAATKSYIKLTEAACCIKKKISIGVLSTFSDDDIDYFESAKTVYGQELAENKTNNKPFSSFRNIPKYSSYHTIAQHVCSVFDNCDKSMQLSIKARDFGYCLKNCPLVIHHKKSINVTAYSLCKRGGVQPFNRLDANPKVKHADFGIQTSDDPEIGGNSPPQPI